MVLHLQYNRSVWICLTYSFGLGISGCLIFAKQMKITIGDQHMSTQLHNPKSQNMVEALNKDPSTSYFG